MKMKRLSVCLLFAGLSIAAFTPILTSLNNNYQEVEATQHTSNFDEYTYTGNYYDSINQEGEGLNGSLRKALSSYILPKAWPTYSGSSATSLAVLCQDADEDPTNSSNMIYLYTRDSVKKNAASSWNREHCWPQSRSGNNWGTGKAGTDLLHLRPTYNTTNSTRGNDLYGEKGEGAKKRELNGMHYGWTTSGIFTPLDSVKGDVARIIMYVWTAYTDYYSNLPELTNAFESYETLLRWHTEDRPDVLEGRRNDYVQSSLQKNRNPFVDHPEYAWKIFGEKVSTATKNACMDAYPDNGRKLESISIDNLPTKTEYFVGESLNTEGISISAHYDDQYVKDVTKYVAYSVTKLTTVGTQVVNVTYGSKSASFEVNVKESPVVVELKEIKIDRIPYKTEYFVDDELDLTGLVVKAYYTDDSEKTLASSDYSVGEVDMSATGYKKVSISYQNKTATFDIFVKNKQAPVDPVTPKATKGCGGNIATTSIVLSLLAASGAILILLRKKKEKQK